MTSYQVINKAIDLEGAASSAFRELFNFLVAQLPENEQRELNERYLDVLRQSNHELALDLDKQLEEYKNGDSR